MSFGLTVFVLVARFSLGLKVFLLVWHGRGEYGEHPAAPGGRNCGGERQMGLFWQVAKMPPENVHGACQPGKSGKVRGTAAACVKSADKHMREKNSDFLLKPGYLYANMDILI